jgi:hypothetical protein
VRYISFDIEIADEFELKPGEDLLDHAPFHLAVAATVDGEGNIRLWYSTGADGVPSSQMEESKARELLAFLLESHRAGWRLFAWNGLSFDLRWIGFNAGDLETAAKVALAIYDPMFQFFNQRGFPVSLAAVGEAMGVHQTKLMDAAEAPREWARGNFQRVMDYVVGDCQITNRIVEAISQKGRLSWRKKDGGVGSEPMPRLKTVAEVLRDPEPDQSWMKGPGMKRSRFTEWLPRHIMDSIRTIPAP